MDTPWIRSRDVPAYYSLGKTHAYELLSEFRAVAGQYDLIKDGRITLVKKESFENFLINRGK